MLLDTVQTRSLQITRVNISEAEEIPPGFLVQFTALRRLIPALRQRLD